MHDQAAGLTLVREKLRTGNASWVFLPARHHIRNIEKHNERIEKRHLTVERDSVSELI